MTGLATIVGPFGLCFFPFGPCTIEGIEGIAFVYFSERDVVRHPLVQEIVKAYNRYEQRLETPSLQRPS